MPLKYLWGYRTTQLASKRIPNYTANTQKGYQTTQLRHKEDTKLHN